MALGRKLVWHHQRDAAKITFHLSAFGPFRWRLHQKSRQWGARRFECGVNEPAELDIHSEPVSTVNTINKTTSADSEIETLQLPSCSGQWQWGHLTFVSITRYVLKYSNCHQRKGLNILFDNILIVSLNVILVHIISSLKWRCCGAFANCLTVGVIKARVLFMASLSVSCTDAPPTRSHQPVPHVCVCVCASNTLV